MPEFVDDSEAPDGLLYDAWVLIANGGYWDPTDQANTSAWLDARDRWRDRWHAQLESPAGVSCQP